jgi:hypothetical protein
VNAIISPFSRTRPSHKGAQMKHLLLAIVLVSFSHHSYGDSPSEVVIPDSLEEIVQFERHNISQSNNEDKKSYAYNVGHTDDVLFYLMVNSELDAVDENNMERVAATVTFHQWLVSCSNQFVRQVLRQDWEVHYVYHNSAKEQKFVSKVDSEICKLVLGWETDKLATRYAEFINKRLPIKSEFSSLNRVIFKEGILAFTTSTNATNLSDLIPQYFDGDREAAGESLSKLILVKEVGNNYCASEIYNRFLKDGIVISVTYSKSDGSEIITFYLTEERCNEYKSNERIQVGKPFSLE